MLCVLTTDAVVDAGHAGRRAARARPRRTFDRVDSDGCMSTNDTVLLLASGASGVDADAGRLRRRGARSVCADLARQLLADAEGATKEVAIEVRRRGRPRPTRSRSAGRSPATTCSSARCSATTPTGAGCWPRSAPPPAAFEPDALDVAINGVAVCRGGAAAADRAIRSTSPAGTCTIAVDLHAGDASRDDLDQRPVRTPTCTRTRRTRHDHSPAPRTCDRASRWRRRRRSSRRCRGWSASTARSS